LKTGSLLDAAVEVAVATTVVVLDVAAAAATVQVPDLVVVEPADVAPAAVVPEAVVPAAVVPAAVVPAVVVDPVEVETLALVVVDVEEAWDETRRHRMIQVENRKLNLAIARI